MYEHQSDPVTSRSISLIKAVSTIWNGKSVTKNATFVLAPQAYDISWSIVVIMEYVRRIVLKRNVRMQDASVMKAF